MAAPSRISERRWSGPFGLRLPLWVGAVFTLAMSIAIGVVLAERRHPTVGVAACAFYATIFMSVLLLGERMASWTDRHRFIDSLFLFPFLAFALLLISPWPAIVCLAITVGAGVPFVAFVSSRARSTGRGPGR